jgi:hypothetical protein
MQTAVRGSEEHLLRPLRVAEVVEGRHDRFRIRESFQPFVVGQRRHATGKVHQREIGEDDRLRPQPLQCPVPE